jgi:hypothetical protein
MPQYMTITPQTSQMNGILCVAYLSVIPCPVFKYIPYLCSTCEMSWPYTYHILLPFVLNIQLQIFSDHLRDVL